ncbi:hypothetical protein E2562_003177 [Oryza meyeriana var. granulata]|uniref:Uncharacterized protein n=1 Tax=Oryza meyeriana var. granulata TaxID=110450 RepID=A0A6G1EUQ4_9ORYZ|nr:hypothetical protein E2562_003177 [Oryza meyeriana var. granulata]
MPAYRAMLGLACHLIFPDFIMKARSVLLGGPAARVGASDGELLLAAAGKGRGGRATATGDGTAKDEGAGDGCGW